MAACCPGILKALQAVVFKAVNFSPQQWLFVFVLLCTFNMEVKQAGMCDSIVDGYSNSYKLMYKGP